MIFWNVLLSILVCLSILLSVYTLILTIRNKKAILEILLPEVEQQKNRLVKLSKKL